MPSHLKIDYLHIRRPKSTFIRKREAVNRVINVTGRIIYKERSRPVSVGNINLFGGCRWTRAPAPLSRRVILNIGVKEFKLYAGTNERATLSYLLP